MGDLKTRCFPKMSTEEMEGGGGSGQPTSTRLPRILMTTQEIEDLKRIVDPGAQLPQLFRPGTPLQLSSIVCITTASCTSSTQPHHELALWNLVGTECDSVNPLLRSSEMLGDAHGV